MAEENLGRIGFVNKQTWQDGEHKLNDVVTYQGAVYACIQPHTSVNGNILPTNTAYWAKWVDNDKYTKQETKELLAQTPNKNYIINGGFQIWQRGYTFSDMGGMTADRFLTTVNQTANRKVDRMPLTQGQQKQTGTEFALRLDTTAQTSFDNRIVTEIEGIFLSGREVTLSLYARATQGAVSITPEVRVYKKGTSGHTNLNLASKPLTGTLTKYSWTFTVPNATTITGANPTDKTTVLLAFTNVKTKIDITAIKLEEGDIATPFVLEDYAVELLKCQRYYEQSCYGVPINSKTSTGRKGFNMLLKNYDYPYFSFSAPKRVSPSIQFANPTTGTLGKFSSSSGADVQGVVIENSTDGFAIQNTSGVDSQGIWFQYSASAEL